MCIRIPHTCKKYIYTKKDIYTIYIYVCIHIPHIYIFWYNIYIWYVISTYHIYIWLWDTIYTHTESARIHLLNVTSAVDSAGPHLYLPLLVSVGCQKVLCYILHGFVWKFTHPTPVTTTGLHL